MLIDKKEVDKKWREAWKVVKEAIDLTKNNMIIGSYLVGGPEKARKPRKTKATTPETQPEAPPAEKPKRTRKSKLPDLDKGGYMNERGKAEEE